MLIIFRNRLVQHSTLDGHMKTFGVSIVGFLRFLPNSVGLEAMYARKYYCYETDETPQPKANPTQEKIGLNVSHFFFFGGWD